MIDADTRERVYLALCGLADDAGFLLSFKRQEVLDYAGVRDADFEAAVDALVASSRLRVDKPSSRRRFQVLDLSARRRAGAYITANRNRVAALASERVRLADRRIDGSAASSRLPLMSILNVEAAPPGKTARYFFTVNVAGFGTLKHCVYVMGERPFVAGPSLRAGNGWAELVEFSPAAKQELLELVERAIAGGLHQHATSSP